jgi:hypothetical protein
MEIVTVMSRPRARGSAEDPNCLSVRRLFRWLQRATRIRALPMARRASDCRAPAGASVAAALRRCGAAADYHYWRGPPPDCGGVLRSCAICEHRSPPFSRSSWRRARGGRLDPATTRLAADCAANDMALPPCDPQSEDQVGTAHCPFLFQGWRSGRGVLDFRR